MNEAVINKMNLYRGGLGTLETKQGYMQVRIDEVDEEKQMVSGVKFELEFTNYDPKKMVAGTQETGTSFEMPFNEIHGFSGKFLEEDTPKEYKIK